MSATLDLAKQLIALPSVTPDDGGCQKIIAERLSKVGFNIEHMPFGDVANLWAVTEGEGPLFVFAGHTDVVPTGPEEEWQSPPFSPTEENGDLIGRGAADMKGSIAAMITAVERFLDSRQANGRIGFLITSDEEGIAIDGTKRVIEELGSRSISIDYCIVGEPSSSEKLADVIKIGRRGSLSGKLAIKGVQGHIAYPQLASNPIHAGLDVLAKLAHTEWDQGNEAFPPTSFQISNIHAGVGAGNVIPGVMTVDFNLRYSTELDAATIKKRVESELEKLEVDHEIDWVHSGEPFLTKSGVLTTAVCDSIKELTGRETRLSTEGGTSDGRFIAPTGTQLIELGPCNATIHKTNERTNIAELDELTEIYQAVLARLL